MSCGSCCQFRPATLVLLAEAPESEAPAPISGPQSTSTEEMQVAADFDSATDLDSIADLNGGLLSRGQVIQNILALQPGQRLSDAFRNLRPTAQGCPRQIVGPITATVQQTCPQVFQVPATQTYQTLVPQVRQRLEFQPVQRTTLRPVLRQYVQQIPVTGQRQVLRNVVQNVTQQYQQQI